MLEFRDLRIWNWGLETERRHVKIPIHGFIQQHFVREIEYDVEILGEKSVFSFSVMNGIILGCREKIEHWLGCLIHCLGAHGVCPEIPKAIGRDDEAWSH